MNCEGIDRNTLTILYEYQEEGLFRVGCVGFPYRFESTIAISDQDTSPRSAIHTRPDSFHRACLSFTQSLRIRWRNKLTQVQPGICPVQGQLRIPVHRITYMKTNGYPGPASEQIQCVPVIVALPNWICPEPSPRERPLLPTGGCAHLHHMVVMRRRLFDSFEIGPSH